MATRSQWMQGVVNAENRSRKDGKFEIEDNLSLHRLGKNKIKKAIEDFAQGVTDYYNHAYLVEQRNIQETLKNGK